MAFWRIFGTRKELLEHFSEGEEEITNERITELALFRMKRTNEMVQKQTEAIKMLLRQHPVDKKVMARLKKEFGL